MAAPAGQGDAQSQAALGMMGPMFVLLAVMLLLTFNPGLRTLMADSAASVIEPTIPFHSDYFVPTVFIIGSSIMVKYCNSWFLWTRLPRFILATEINRYPSN